MKIIKKIPLILMIFTLNILMSCDKESNKILLDETDGHDYKTYDLYTDENGNQGIIIVVSNSAYTENNNLQSIMVLSLDETYCPWGQMGDNVSCLDTVSSNVSSGSFGLSIYQNMKAIGIDKYPAQAWCDAKNNYYAIPYSGSWRLPSFYEFRLIFKGLSLSRINSALKKYGGTTIDKSNYYWTCSEDINGYIKLNGVNGYDYDADDRAVISTTEITTTKFKDIWVKKNSHYVRAIKYIYYYDKY